MNNLPNVVTQLYLELDFISAGIRLTDGIELTRFILYSLFIYFLLFTVHFSSTLDDVSHCLTTLLSLICSLISFSSRSKLSNYSND